jgi:hypothetical protein
MRELEIPGNTPGNIERPNSLFEDEDCFRKVRGDTFSSERLITIPDLSMPNSPNQPSARFVEPSLSHSIASIPVEIPSMRSDPRNPRPSTKSRQSPQPRATAGAIVARTSNGEDLVLALQHATSILAGTQSACSTSQFSD